MPKDPETRERGVGLAWAVFAVLMVFLVQDLIEGARTVEEIPYGRFLEALERGEATDLVVGGAEIRGTWNSPHGETTGFVTRRVDPEIAETLRKADVPFRGAVESTWFGTLISWVAPAAVFVGLWYLVIRRLAQGGGLGGPMAVGRSKAKIFVETDTRVSFEDVAGADEAKAELQELVEFLKDPEGRGRLGARAPKGVLLLGPPGTGKTLMARAVAGEAGVPFFSISGSEFVEMFVGVGAARVRDLFEQARKRAPAIIFIDELDALGRARGAVSGLGGHDEREQTLNQLLTELDGFDASVGVVLLAATNRPEILDPALLRAGRFDRQILMDRPDKTGRAAILRVHMRKAEIAPEVDPEAVAALTTGFTGADLANLVNEAALAATRRGADAVEMEDFTAAIERIVAGLERRKRVMNPKERKAVAVHECGHVLVALALPGQDAVHKVSIIPRGVGALGYTMQRPEEDRYLMGRDELENRIAMLLAGRAAERLVEGRVSTGAADDLVKATDMARAMVTRYGMDEGLGPVAWERGGPAFLQGPDGPQAVRSGASPETEARIDAAVRAILERGEERATAVLEANGAILERMAAALLERETLESEDIAALTAGLATPATRAAE